MLVARHARTPANATDVTYPFQMRTLAAVVPLLVLASAVPPAGASSPDDAVDRVLVISVDGLNPKAITRYASGLTPNFHRLFDEGAGSFNARTLYEETETLPNHTGMFTGRRAALPRGTGVRFNSDNGSTLHATAGHYVAGVFDVVHDRGGSTAMYVAKSKFAFLDRSWDAQHGRPDTTGVDNGRDKVDLFRLRDGREDRLVAELDAELLSAPRTLTFLHLAAPDRAGHAYGGMGPEYLRAVRTTDALLGKVLHTIDSSPALKKHLLVILTADHGTRSLSHDDPRKLANYRIPFVAWGPGVTRGANLYALNPEFQRPGIRRPGYNVTQPIRNGDVANLVTDVLDLPRVPGSEFDVPRTLDLGPAS